MALVICSVALAASLLTLFSGFGLGTLLLPAFAAFFPVEAAVAMTAIVHCANNVFKLGLLGKKADWRIAARFGLPAIAAAFLGARVLLWLSGLPPLAGYSAMGRLFLVSPVKLSIASLMLAFAALEAVPALKKVSFDRRHLPLGGALSGFFGGLSGHQGALRSAFLVRCGLTQEGFVATGVVVACLVDLTRLAVYSRHLSAAEIVGNRALLAAAVLSAFAGAWLGSRLLMRMTIRAVRLIVSWMLASIAILLGAGII